MVINPVAFNGIVGFSSLLTTSDSCSPSAQSRGYAVNCGTGRSVLLSGSTGFVSVSSSVINLRFISVDSSTRIIAGTTKGETKKVSADMASGISLGLLN